MMDFRALELHGKQMWDHKHVEQALALMKTYGLNALVLHESDLMTDFIFPSSVFDPSAPWAGAPARRGENALHNNQAYLKDILRRAGRQGAGVWVEVKELTFPDEILEKQPHLFKDGTICPTDPFWFDFIPAKYRDLANLYPEIRGVIVSAGSPEGRSSLSQRKCHCARCEMTELSGWYASIIAAMYTTLKSAGMRLAVREFSYNAEHRKAITDAVTSLPSDIVYCIKVTPHDFYPTFPDNELIETVTDREKWIEYDAMGQYSGWGIFPCFMNQDISERFDYALRSKVNGVLLRVEWERVNDWWALDTPNRMNLHAGALAAQGKPASGEELIRAWAGEEETRLSSGELGLFREFLDGTWPILRKALYINDFVYNDSSQFPLSVERSWWSMADKHSLSEWDPSRKQDLNLDRDKVETYSAEKESAAAAVLAWKKRFDGATLPGILADYPGKVLPGLVLYVEGFRLTSRVCLLSSWIGQTKEEADKAYARERLGPAVAALLDYTRDLRTWLGSASHRHQIYMIMNPDRADALAEGGSGWIKR